MMKQESKEPNLLTIDPKSELKFEGIVLIHNFLLTAEHQSLYQLPRM